MTKEKESEMTFLEHLEEFRWHLIRSLIAVVVFTTLAFVYYDIIFDSIILAPKNSNFPTNRFFCYLAELWNSESLCINNKPLDLINITMGGQFNTHLIVSFFTGLVLTFPYLFYEFWRFVSPALHQKERRAARGMVFAASFLFLLGVSFGYFIIVPLSVHFLSSYSVSDQVKNIINLSSYISTVVSIVLASGVLFELPIVIYFLAKIGIVSPKFLRKYRRHAYLIILVIAAIITPPDVFSQLLVTIPLVGLYEVSILLAAGIERKKNKKKEQEG